VNATGLGAWIEAIRNSSTIHPSRTKYAHIATAMHEWRLEDAAQSFSQGLGKDGREVWPSIAHISNALIWHDGIVDAPIAVPISQNKHRIFRSTKRFIFKGCVPQSIQVVLFELSNLSAF
jgi:hypothetical protein